MSFLLHKNLATFRVIVLLLLVSIISNKFIIAPACKLHHDTAKFNSCVKIATESRNDITPTDVPLVHEAYLIILYEACYCLHQCFLNNNMRNPFSSRSKVKKPRSLYDLTYEVLTILQSKLDFKYMLFEVAEHIIDVCQTSIHAIIIDHASDIVTSNIEHNWEMAEHKLSPLVKKCGLSNWQQLAGCKVHEDGVFQLVFNVLWGWYAFTTIVAIFEIVLIILRYILRRQQLNDMRQTEMEGWLVEICKSKLHHLNWMARSLGLRNFRVAARLVVLDRRVEAYATRGFGYNPRAPGSITDNH